MSTKEFLPTQTTELSKDLLHSQVKIQIDNSNNNSYVDGLANLSLQQCSDKDMSVRHKSYSSSKTSSCPSKKILSKLQEKKEQQQRLDILINRLHRLKNMEIQVKSKAEKIKIKVLNEESIKLSKQQMKVELELKKYKTNELTKQKNNLIVQHKSEEKKSKEQRHQKKMLEQKELYSNAINNRKLISKLLEQIDDSEHKLKAHNYQKVNESRNKTKINTKIKTFEAEHNIRANYMQKVNAIGNEVENIKQDISRLETAEQEAINKINSTLNLQGMMEKDIRDKIAKILVSESKPIEKELKIEKLISQRQDAPSKGRMISKKKDCTHGLTLLRTNFSLNCSSDLHENGMKTQMSSPIKGSKHSANLLNPQKIKNAISSKPLINQKRINQRSSERIPQYPRTRAVSPKIKPSNISNARKKTESRASKGKINQQLPPKNMKLSQNKGSKH